MGVMERIGGGIEVTVLGQARCPLCGRTSRRVRFFALEMDEACPACQEAALRRAEDEERQERIELLLRLAGATPLYLDWSLASYPDEKLVRQVRGWLSRYAKGMRENVMLVGPQGAGKTGLAWSAIRELMETRLMPTRIATWREALDVMRDSMRRATPTTEMMSLRRVPVLVLDDVGSERPTEFALQELLTLVDYRMLHKLPTWFTSNYNLDELADRLGHEDALVGERIASRMANGALQLRVDAPDRRQG